MLLQAMLDSTIVAQLLAAEMLCVTGTSLAFFRGALGKTHGGPAQDEAGNQENDAHEASERRRFMT
jgi:hypothetical protein